MYESVNLDVCPQQQPTQYTLTEKQNQFMYCRYEDPSFLWGKVDLLKTFVQHFFIKSITKDGEKK